MRMCSRKRHSHFSRREYESFSILLGEMEDVVSLTVGQPDFVTPWHIREAAIDSLEQGKTYYTSNSRYRWSCAMRYRDYLAPSASSLHYDRKRRDTRHRRRQRGYRSVLSVPCVERRRRGHRSRSRRFVCYGPIVTLAGGTPVFVETKEEDRFKITPEAAPVRRLPRAQSCSCSHIPTTPPARS